MTPIDLANTFVKLGRRNGKTTELVKSLPDEKCAVLALSNADINDIKQMIKEHRPDYDMDYVTFLVYNPDSGWRDKLLFRDMHVFIDNSVLDLNSVYLTKAINDVYGKTLSKSNKKFEEATN